MENFKQYLEKLKQSEKFKEFKKEYPDAYLGAGFFILDLDEKSNDKKQIDYALPDGKIATFDVGGKEIQYNITEKVLKKDGEKEELKEITQESEIGFKEIGNIVKKEMKNKEIKNNLNKVIAVLQMLDKKLIWNLQCVLSDLSVLNIHIDDSTKEILKFKKFAMSDIIGKMKK